MFDINFYFRNMDSRLNKRKNDDEDCGNNSVKRWDLVVFASCLTINARACFVGHTRCKRIVGNICKGVHILLFSLNKCREKWLNYVCMVKPILVFIILSPRNYKKSYGFSKNKSSPLKIWFFFQNSFFSCTLGYSRVP